MSVTPIRISHSAMIGSLLAATVLLLCAPAGLPAQDEGEPAEDSSSIEPDPTRGRDLVVGLTAFNRQVMEALAKQPTNRVILLPFPTLDGRYTAASTFIKEQLVTALAARGDYQIMPGDELLEIARQAGVPPMELANTDAFRTVAQRYRNDSIVAGTLTDLGSKVALMARVIVGRSGQYGGGAIVYLTVTDELAALLQRQESSSRTMVEAADTTEEESTARMPDREIESKPIPEQTATSKPKDDGPLTIPTVNTANLDDLAIYRIGRDHFEKGNYATAIGYFQQVVERYPESALADNAVYWIGESHYSLRRYRDARDIFKSVLERYPYGNKVPAATLKKGFAEEELGNLPAAIAAMEEVIGRFKDSPEADIARRKIQLLRARQEAGE